MGRRRRVVRSSTFALGGWHVTTAWPAGPFGSNRMACWAGGCRRLHGLLGLHPHESLQAGNSRPGGAEYKNLKGGGAAPPGSAPLSEGENSCQRPSRYGSAVLCRRRLRYFITITLSVNPTIDAYCWMESTVDPLWDVKYAPLLSVCYEHTIFHNERETERSTTERQLSERAAKARW